jgi:hypothetical protein
MKRNILNFRQFVRLNEAEESVSTPLAAADPHKISTEIVHVFLDSSFWAPYKGINDAEGPAIAAFSSWWDKNIQPKINTLPQGINRRTLNNLKAIIVEKMEGGTMNDAATWNIGAASYSVDTDF